MDRCLSVGAMCSLVLETLYRRDYVSAMRRYALIPTHFFPLFRFRISPGVKKAGAGYFYQRPAYRSCNHVLRDAVFASAGCAGFNWLIQTVLE